MEESLKTSELDIIEQTMLEDKMHATDWEATNEALEEAVARESYYEWLRENEKRARAKCVSCSAITIHPSFHLCVPLTLTV